MSIISEKIAEYVMERPKGWPALRDWLATRRYPDPARAREQDVIAASSDDFPYTDGTWDEVTRARNFGLLTDDEYNQVVRLADKAVKRGSLSAQPGPR